jgi:hypothetical protein
VFCLIRDMRTFCTLLLICWTPNKWRAVQSGRYLRLWKGLHVFYTSYARREATTVHGVKATLSFWVYNNGRVKSHYRPGVAQRVPGN